jgi:hypothetical protein
VSICTDNVRFVNALREALGKEPLPNTSDRYKRVEHEFMAHALRGAGNGNFRCASLAAGGTGRAPKHEV